MVCPLWQKGNLPGVSHLPGVNGRHVLFFTVPIQSPHSRSFCLNKLCSIIYHT